YRPSRVGKHLDFQIDKLLWHRQLVFDSKLIARVALVGLRLGSQEGSQVLWMVHECINEAARTTQSLNHAIPPCPAVSDLCYGPRESHDTLRAFPLHGAGC